MLQLRKRSDKPFFTPNAWWWSGFLVMWGEFGILELSRQRQVFGRKKYTTQLAIEWAIPGNQCQYRWFPNHVPEMCNLTLSQSKSTLQAWSYSNLPSNRLWIISDVSAFCGMMFLLRNIYVVVRPWRKGPLSTQSGFLPFHSTLFAH